MDALEAILTRRSTREFLDKKVSKDTIDQLLKAAMNAPSARNEQPWHFLVIDDKEILREIPSIHPHARMCLQAPLAIITCGQPDLTKEPSYWFEDLAAATQNILLAARALGLGAVWAGVYPNEERVEAVKSHFLLPENIVPFNIIPIGYTNFPQKEVERYNEARVHINKW